MEFLYLIVGAALAAIPAGIQNVIARRQQLADQRSRREADLHEWRRAERLSAYRALFNEFEKFNERIDEMSKGQTGTLNPRLPTLEPVVIALGAARLVGVDQPVIDDLDAWIADVRASGGRPVEDLARARRQHLRAAYAKAREDCELLRREAGQKTASAVPQR